MGAAALTFVVTRTDPGSCRAAAWGSLPAVNTLPAGWTATASGIYIDSVGTTLTGPTPSASDESPPAIFVSVGCYGADAHLGVTRSHDTSRSTGGTDISFASVGDESFATRDATTGEYTVVVRRSQLVATLAAAGTISLDDLSTAARAVDAAMRAGTAGTAGGGAAVAASRAPGGPSPSPSPSTASAGSPGASGEVQHAAPALEAALPDSAAGVKLSRASFLGTDVLSTDAPSKALTAAITALGRKPADLSIAEGFDASGARDWYVDVFELRGVSGNALGTAIRSAWIGAGASNVTSTSSTIGGKRVTRLDRGSGAAPDTVYVHGSRVWDVSSSDPAVVSAVLAKLP
jgi:hypothetical protein